MVALSGSALIGLRLAGVAPFVTYVRMPAVLHLTESTAVQEIRDAGLGVRVLAFRRTLPRGLYRRVLGVSDLPAARVVAGSRVTLYVAIPRATAKRAAR
jgi:beta-lactam-binding protein with PASTA domain